MELGQRLGAILRALNITKVEYSLSGGGDSGESVLERIECREGEDRTTLPDIPVFITDSGQIRNLPELLENIVADAPEGDWVNNEGGFGTVAVFPFDDEEDLTIVCDMTFREDGDYGDDEDDEDFVDDVSDESDEIGSDVAVPLFVVGEVAP